MDRRHHEYDVMVRYTSMPATDGFTLSWQY
jgi:hypothetical protein